MAWFKVDDGFYTSQKFLTIPRELQVEAAGVWLVAGTWSADKMTDGFVPYGVMNLWEFKTEIVEHLVRVGFWDHDEEHDGIMFHDWCDYQPTREQLQEKHEAKVAAGSKGGRRSADARKANVEAESKQNPSRTEAEFKQIQAEGKPEPEPEPEPITAKAVIHAHPSLESSFNQFWEAWPRAEGKKSAFTAWTKAVKKTQPEVIISVAKAFSASPHRPEKQFIPFAATWLNGERWTDPLPDAPEAEKPKGAPTPYVPTLDEFKSMLCLHGRPANACERCDEESAHG
jgi:hypothetical protein